MQDGVSTGMHVGAAFGTLGASFVGVALPVVAARPGFSVLARVFSPSVLSSARFLGAGAILSTAFVHLVSSSIDDFAQSRLRKASVICCLFIKLGAILMICADYAVASYTQHKERHAKRRHAHVHGHTHDSDGGLANSESCCCGTAILVAAVASASTDLKKEAPQPDSPPDLECNKDSSQATPDGDKASDASAESTSREDDEDEAIYGKLGFYMLEAGIAVHSVVVGIALGMSNSGDYITLLIAIVFHQLLEGFALGAMASPLNLSTRALLTLILSFSLTVVLGLAIGATVANSITIDSKIAFSTGRGVVSAIAAGIMIYSTITEAVVPLLRDPKIHSLSTRKQAFFAMLFMLGSIIMSILAFFA